MSRLLLAGVVALLGMTSSNAEAAGRGAHSRYEVPLIVKAIVNDRLEAISGEPEHFDAAVQHLVGFMMRYDSMCDFLPLDIFEKAKKVFSEAVESAEVPGATADAKFRSRAAMAGVRDAERFHGRHRCNSRDARRAIATLRKVGDKATAIGRGLSRDDIGKAGHPEKDRR